MSEDLPRFMHRLLRIPEKDAKKYTDHLIDMGYDDIQAFIEDLTPEEVQFMKPGHFRRAEFFLNSIKDRDKDDLLKVITEELSSDTTKIWTIKPDLQIEALKIGDSSISGINNMMKNEGDTDFLRAIGFENEIYYSNFDHRYINLSASIEMLQQIGEGATSTVFLSIHTYTLALLAVKCISLDNQSPKSSRLKLVATELNVLSSISRHPLHRAYEGHDLYCTICQGGTCQVPSRNSSRESLQTTSTTETVLHESSSGSGSRNDEFPCLYIVNFYDAYTDIHRGDVCLIFEYMYNGNLNQLCESGWVPDDYNMAAVAYSVLSGIAQLHKQRIIHRDIKMQNILVSQNGKIKISDFGIVNKLPFESGSAAKTFTGTLSYMSPDRLQGLPYSFECDIWAFGITMMRLCNFKHCQGKSVDEQFFGRELSYWDIIESVVNGKHINDFINMSTDDLKPMFKELILQCLIVDPAQRPSAETLLHHPYILSHLNRDEFNIHDLIQPRLTDLPFRQPTSRKNIANVIEKVIANIFARHEFREIWRAEEIWEEANRRHLALVLGCDYEELTDMLQSELDRRCEAIKALREATQLQFPPSSSSSSSGSSSGRSRGQNKDNEKELGLYDDILSPDETSSSSSSKSLKSSSSSSSKSQIREEL